MDGSHVRAGLEALRKCTFVNAAELSVHKLMRLEVPPGGTAH
jgi:hypothetical protein